MTEVWECYQGKAGPPESRPAMTEDGTVFHGTTQAQYDEIMAGLP
jgi:hypothetical protein